MSSRIIPLFLACGSLLPLFTARADLLTDLIAYYDFEQTGSAGLANKAPGATSYDATRQGTLHADWSSGSDPTGPGFAGKTDYLGAGSSGLSNRSTLLVGKALNLDGDRNEYVQIPLGTTELGTSFTISAWHALTPGVSNTNSRYHVFEATNGFDVSWGTPPSASTVLLSAYTYLAYVGEAPVGGFGPTGLANGTWHHTAHTITSEGGTTTIRLYVNGKFFGSRSVATSTMNFPSFLLGRHRTAEIQQDRDWDGMLDEVAVWTRALSDSEVQELYHRGTGAITLNADLAAAGKAFVSVLTDDPVMGQTSGAGIYNINQQAAIAATPTPGHVFTEWSGAPGTPPASFNLTVTQRAEITGSFARDMEDNDSDDLTNYEELVTYATNPNNADSDGDQLRDGDEVFYLQTSPLVSQAALVNYILENIAGAPGAGATVLARNEANNTLTLRLKPGSSTTLQGAFGSLTPASPGVTGAASAGDFRLQVPGTADDKRFFRVEGVKP